MDSLGTLMIGNLRRASEKPCEDGLGGASWCRLVDDDHLLFCAADGERLAAVGWATPGSRGELMQRPLSVCGAALH